MKTYLTFVFLTISLIGLSNSYPTIDTISHWKVYNDGVLLKEMNVFDQNSKIIIKKGKIRRLNPLRIQYFNDTPCFDCSSKIIIRTKKGKIIRTIENTKSNYDFEIETTELQVLILKNRSSLTFYYKEHVGSHEILLFEFDIK